MLPKTRSQARKIAENQSLTPAYQHQAEKRAQSTLQEEAQRLKEATERQKQQETAGLQKQQEAAERQKQQEATELQKQLAEATQQEQQAEVERQREIEKACQRGSERRAAASAIVKASQSQGKGEQSLVSATQNTDKQAALRAAFFQHLRSKNWGSYQLPQENIIKTEKKFWIGNHDKNHPIGCEVEFLEQGPIFSLLSTESDDSLDILKNTIAAFLSAHRATGGPDLEFCIEAQTEEDAARCLSLLRDVQGLKITQLIVQPANGTKEEWDAADIQKIYQNWDAESKARQNPSRPKP